MAAVGIGGGTGGEGGVRAWVGPARAEPEPRVLDAVKLALELGVDPNVANLDGRTALDAASALKYQSVVERFWPNTAPVQESNRLQPSPSTVGGSRRDCNSSSRVIFDAGRGLVCGRTDVSSVILCSFLVAGTAAAQQGSSAIRGRVTDQADAVLPGVAITVTHAESGTIRETVSGPDGTYLVPGLLPGPTASPRSCRASAG